jgi:hypothetical protein
MADNGSVGAKPVDGRAIYPLDRRGPAVIFQRYYTIGAAGENSPESDRVGQSPPMGRVRPRVIKR